jgi:DNA-binding MarR family transcriptional regulator
VAFLLAQLGHHASDLFARRIDVLDLSPAQAGILRLLSAEPGPSQQALSARLGLLPSRVVAFVDDLEERGYLERRRNRDDRRLYALFLTPAGEQLMGRLSAIAREHEQDITSGLSVDQRRTLSQLLSLLAEQRGLTPGVHPGYRSMGGSDGSMNG